MDFKDLSYVIAIAKTQNITKAADMLYVTQPTLTKFLQNLEREMGQKLFKKFRKPLCFNICRGTLCSESHRNF